MSNSLPEYKLYAIKYAHRAARRSDHFVFGDPHDGPMDMDYFIWVAVSYERTFVIDLGFGADAGLRRKREFLRCPIQSLRLIGIDPATVQDAIITHLHYDHAGNFKLLPQARFHIQEPEIHFATGHHVHHAFFAPGYEVEDIVDVVRLNFARRVSYYNGRVDLAPGISLEPAPGHTPGQQVVRVHTRRGWVIVLSDAAHYYEHIRNGRPYPAVTNIAELLDSYDRIWQMADSLERMIPGHDSLIHDFYPPAEESLRGIVTRLDAEPDAAKFQAHWDGLPG